MIGSGIVKGESQEYFEGVSVIDLSFQFRIGVDVKPLLKQQAFHKQYRRISFGASGAFADGIGPQEQFFDSGPINDGLICYILLMALFFSMEVMREISVKVKLDCIFLKPIVSPKGDFCRDNGKGK